MQLKKLNDQVLVITEATNGIGLVTARMAVARGARVVLAARNEDALKKIVEEITSVGREAIYVIADLGREPDVRRIADAAIERFGGFDTWVNNAGVSIYGRLVDVSIEDQRRLFETNYWGVVYGSRVAVEHLRCRGGALITIGSALSDRAIPLQGAYCASKHAVKGYTDALRVELEQEGAPISVTLIKPSAIDAPYKRHAKNYLSVDSDNLPPIYAPELVAEAILRRAEELERENFVGAGGKALSALVEFAPRLTDKLMELAFFALQKTDRSDSRRERNSLYKPSADLAERGGYEGNVAESSHYTKASLRPAVAGAIAVGAGLALSAWLRRR